MGNIEIERKYLMNRFPEAELQTGIASTISVQHIDQTYLALAENEEIRIRRLTCVNNTLLPDQFTHTFKKGNGLVREEIEYEISEDIYAQLLRSAGKVPLTKVRTTLQCGEHRYEIDVYESIGLQVVEVEFPDLLAAGQFVPPDWFGEEISHVRQYSNKEMWKALQQDSSH